MLARNMALLSAQENTGITLYFIVTILLFKEVI
jgi:hypothetical protein